MSIKTASIEFTKEQAQNLLVCIEQTVKLGGPNLPNTCQFFLDMRVKLIDPFLENKIDGNETE